MKSKRQAKIIIILILLTLLYYIAGILSPRDFWVEDEARYAEVLREMIHEGKWLVPHLNGAFYPDKPPIYFWLSALIALVMGKIIPSSFLAITWLSTLGTILVNYYFARALFDDRSAFISSLILMANFLMLGCAQIVRMDMLLTFFVTLALHVFYLGHQKSANRYFILFYLFSALAVLTKGPFGFAFTYLPAIAFLSYKRDWLQLKKVVFNYGFILFIILVGGWLAGSWLMGYSDFVKNLFVKQIAGRTVKAFSHQEPFYFYILLLPLVLLPWTAFVPRAIRYTLQNNRDHIYLFFWWFMTGFVMISVVSGKLFIYLLPLIVPIAMMLGNFFGSLWQTPKSVSWWLTVEGFFSVGLTFGIFAILPMIIRKFPVVYQLNLESLSFIFIPFMILGIVISITRKTKILFVMTIIGMWLFSVYTFQFIAPRINNAFSARAIGQQLSKYAESGHTAATFQVRRGILNFYANKIIPELELADLSSYFDDSNRIMVIKTNEYQKRIKPLNIEISILNSYNIANENYVIIGRIKEN